MMARLSEEEIARIRREHNIKPEHIGPTPQNKRRKPSGKKAPEPSVDVCALFT